MTTQEHISRYDHCSRQLTAAREELTVLRAELERWRRPGQSSPPIEIVRWCEMVDGLHASAGSFGHTCSEVRMLRLHYTVRYDLPIRASSCQAVPA